MIDKISEIIKRNDNVYNRSPTEELCTVVNHFSEKFSTF